MSISDAEFFPSPQTLSGVDYAEISLKVAARWSRDVATMKTYAVFYAESLPVVMPTEPGEYPHEGLKCPLLVESGNATDHVVPAFTVATSAAHWFYAHSKTGHSSTAWLRACADAYALIEDEK